MSSTASELSLTAFEAHKEKRNSPHWTLAQGDLDKLFNDENSNECVLFERNLPKIHHLSVDWQEFVKTLPIIKTKYGNYPDYFAKTDIQKLKVTQVVLCRTEMQIYDYYEDTWILKNGRKRLTLFFCLGDGIRRAIGRPSPGTTQRFNYVLDPRKDFKSAGLSASEMFIFSFFRQHGLPDEWKPISDENRLDKLYQYDRLYTETYLGFQIGEMHPNTVPQLINILHKLNMVTNDDIPFLNAIAKPRDLLAEEHQLNSEMHKALVTGEVKIALEKAGMLHAFSRNYGKAMGTLMYETMEAGKAVVIVPETNTSYAQTEVTPPKIVFTLLDDCPAALNLAEYFEQRNMLDEAMAALEIITSGKQNTTFVCNSKKSALVKYCTESGSTIPYAHFKASGVMSPCDHFTAFQSPYLEPVERMSAQLSLRFNRKKAIKASFMNLWKENPDPLQTLKTVTQQIEAQAGYSESGTVNRLLDKIKLTADNLISIKTVFSEVVNIMADKLTDFRKQKYSTHLAAVDAKRNMEESAIQRRDSEDVAKSNITKAIMNLGNYDFPVAIEMVKTLMGFIENRVGERFLDNISLNPEPTIEVCYELFYEVVITMTEKLYCHRKPESQSTHSLKDADVKRNLEKSLTEHQDGKGEAEAHSLVARSIATTAGSPPATHTSTVPLTFSSLAASTTNTLNSRTTVNTRNISLEEKQDKFGIVIKSF